MIHIERRERDGFALCGAAMGKRVGEGECCAACRLRELRLRREEDARLAGPAPLRGALDEIALDEIPRRLRLRREE